MLYYFLVIRMLYRQSPAFDISLRYFYIIDPWFIFPVLPGSTTLFENLEDFSRKTLSEKFSLSEEQEHFIMFTWFINSYVNVKDNSLLFSFIYSYFPSFALILIYSLLLSSRFYLVEPLRRFFSIFKRDINIYSLDI